MNIYEVKGVRNLKYQTVITLREILMRDRQHVSFALGKAEIFCQRSLFAGI